MKDQTDFCMEVLDRGIILKWSRKKKYAMWEIMTQPFFK
jgi:hypothetical protein